LVIAATLSHRSPFLSPVDNLKEASAAKLALAAPRGAASSRCGPASRSSWSGPSAPDWRWRC
jgi:hypothetical protein